MRLSAILVALLLSMTVHADTVTVAVASNFRATAELLAIEFKAESGNELRISSGSTGKLHAQIMHGAPFDVFLAADANSPRLLEVSGTAVAGSSVTYAIGELVLWSAAEGVVDCRRELEGRGAFRLAIANPDTAPYGRAAREFLLHAGLWEAVEARLVYGENVAQALHFAVSGNARYALIAGSQAIDVRLPLATCHWTVPADAYTPLLHQAVLLQRAASNAAAQEFLRFLQSAAARATIRESGYGVP